MTAAVVLAGGLLEGETRLYSLTIPVAPWAVLLALAIAGAVFHFGLRATLQRLAKRTATDLDDVFFEVSGTAVPLAILLAMLFVSAGMLSPSHYERLQSILQRISGLGGVLLLLWTVFALALRTLRRWAARNAHFAPMFPPLRFVLKAIAAVLGTVTVLRFLNVDVTGVFAALGIGGLAVALSLKDTLENFFAGLHIMADRPVMEGDTILIHETGDRGVVEQIGWRSTRIRTTDNHLLVLPNIKLASGAITNLSAGDPRTHVRVQVGVDTSADPDRVATLLEEEARAGVGSIPGLLADPPPKASLHPGFGPYSLDFTLRATVRGADHASDAEDQLRRRILKRFRAEGIAMPLPITTIRVRNTERDPERTEPDPNYPG